MVDLFSKPARVEVTQTRLECYVNPHALVELSLDLLKPKFGITQRGYAASGVVSTRCIGKLVTDQ